MKIIYLLIVSAIHLIKDDNVELSISCLNFGGAPILKANFYEENIVRNYPVNTFLSFSLLTLGTLVDSRISASERIYLDRDYDTHRYSSSFKFDDLLVENFLFIHSVMIIGYIRIMDSLWGITIKMSRFLLFMFYTIKEK